MAFKCSICYEFLVQNVNESICEKCKEKIKNEQIEKEKREKERSEFIKAKALITYKTCPNCNSQNESINEECCYCFYSFITGKQAKCPNCGKLSSRYFCTCGYNFEEKSMMKRDVVYHTISIRNFYSFKAFDRVDINHCEISYRKYAYKLVRKMVVIDILSEDYFTNSVLNEHCYVTALIKEIDHEKVVVAFSNLPEQLLIEEIKKKLKEEEELNKIRKEMLAKQYLHYGYRTTQCHRCRSFLTTETHFICPVCKWIKCECGACGCNYPRNRRNYY